MEGSIMGIVSIVSIIANVAAALVAPFIRKKIVKKQEQLQTAEEKLDVIAAGLQVVERAVEQNKDDLSKSGPGDAVAKTIRTYGPAARQLVDIARTTARAIREDALRESQQATVAAEQLEQQAVKSAAAVPQNAPQ